MPPRYTPPKDRPRVPRGQPKRRSNWQDSRGPRRNISKGIRGVLLPAHTKAWPSKAFKPPARTQLIEIPGAQVLQSMVEEFRAKFDHFQYFGGGVMPGPEGPVECELDGKIRKAWATDAGHYYFVRNEGEDKNSLTLVGPGEAVMGHAHQEDKKVQVKISSMRKIYGFLFCCSDFKYERTHATQSVLGFFGQFIDYRQRLWYHGDRTQVPQIDYKNLMTLGKEELYMHVVGTTGAFGGPMVPVAVQPLDSDHVAADLPAEGEPVQNAAPGAATQDDDAVSQMLQEALASPSESPSASPLPLQPTLGGAQDTNPDQWLSTTEQVIALFEWANAADDSEEP